jgi:putative peptide zinc metalloprotease protein
MDAAIQMKPSQDKELHLPLLRQDLSVTPSGPGEDGAPTWLLYDPLKNHYYRLGHVAFSMLSCWQGGVSAAQWLKDLQDKNPSIEQSDLEQFINFLIIHGLIPVSTHEDQQRLEEQSKKSRKGGLKWLLMHYLFIRIPLIRPDCFLSATLPFVDFFFRPFFRRLVFFLGATGLLLVIRQWDLFMASILQFFNVKGAIFFAITLFFVKALHELGHAYTAKRQGCRVPTMGVAFLVLYPFLYTDTTDAWKLTSRRQRLTIVTAGIKTELALALIATFIWSFVDTGILKSAAFFVATTSWITTLSINLSPFMRFDGYYALADWLGAENLQQRAFALARWRLREMLFRLDDPVPEALPPERQKIFLIYAYATWIYRFFLFLGIALLVYYLVFKALGIILFIVELIYFIFLPIMNEIKIWWQNRQKISLNRNFILTLCIMAAAIGLVFLPWQSQIKIPAVLEAAHKADIYPPEDGQIETIHVKKGSLVQQGDPLFNLSMPDLEKNRVMLERRAAYIQIRIDRHIGSTVDLDQFEILQRELAKVKTELTGILYRIKRGQILAPQNGHIATLIDGHKGQWVSRQTKLAQIVGIRQTEITAYLEENQLHRIRKGVPATFYSNSGDMASIKAKVISVSATAVDLIAHPEVTSVFGGPIAVRQAENDQLRPERGVYTIILQTEATPEKIPWRIAGQVNIETLPQSPFSHFLRYAAAVFIRESGM